MLDYVSVQWSIQTLKGVEDSHEGGGGDKIPPRPYVEKTLHACATYSTCSLDPFPAIKVREGRNRHACIYIMHKVAYSMTCASTKIEPTKINVIYRLSVYP